MCKFFPIHCTILKHFVNATTWDLAAQLAARSHNGGSGISGHSSTGKGRIPTRPPELQVERPMVGMDIGVSCPPPYSDGPHFGLIFWGDHCPASTI